jgi:hypothetical protein
MTLPSESTRWHLLVIFLAGFLAIASARDYPGGWNDGSRLASVESLVERGTWTIDDSPFVAATQDKLFIDGHYYSDKSPVPAVLMAGEYVVWRTITGQTAHSRPERFCRFLTVATSGLAYVIAVWSIFRLGRPLRLPLGLRLILTASFAVATVAPAYVRHVNNHMLLLGVIAVLLVEAVWLGHEARRPPTMQLVGIGLLAGLAYTIDLGAGPVILLGAFCHVMFRCGWRAALIVATAALPWLVSHHLLNYLIGGTWKPANANPDYLSWPGSPFDATTMTGGWNHPSVGAFVLYAVDLLIGKRGFLGHNLALYLAVPASVWSVFTLSRKRARGEWPELALAMSWCVGVWLLYAATSTNYSGACCSVRWFVPLLAPGYYVLAVFLRERPEFRRDFVVLSLWGAAMAPLMWWKGPWMLRMVPQYWVFVGGAAASWAVVRWLDWRARHTQDTGSVSRLLADTSTPSQRPRNQSAISSTAKRSVA